MGMAFDMLRRIVLPVAIDSLVRLKELITSEHLVAAEPTWPGEFEAIEALRAS